ncbi:MAG: AzlD domain-containing protein [Devosia sp.]|uniref:AzlD family protein n=1 Tax=Devosia sp. TaxID=1871048 RepID=UPI001AC11886|nr:AzlD domain-containing protein [Devosia sp.]MBN9309843.1 AzlD domain-containing protein [Devosia sp.]MBN9315119.1 AzlD domain-containing protein [Devosia sp.]
MSLDALLAILGMAAVTYAIRAGGVALASRLPETGFIATWMRHLPGAVLAALVAPAILAGGPAEAIAAATTALILVLSRNLFAAMAGGVLAVYLARLALGT